jgi:tetratricopeptide (TPR) repeat protein
VAWNSKGIQLARLGRWDEALASFDRAIGIDPTCSEAWFNKGHSLALGLTDHTAAIECLEKAHKLGNAQAGEYIERLRQKIEDGR